MRQAKAGEHETSSFQGTTVTIRAYRAAERLCKEISEAHDVKLDPVCIAAMIDWHTGLPELIAKDMRT